jgi:hypothetical protein
LPRLTFILQTVKIGRARRLHVFKAKIVPYGMTS